MEFGGSLPHSQEHANYPYPESDQSGLTTRTFHVVGLQEYF
jgi:hypothetical protein